MGRNPSYNSYEVGNDPLRSIHERVWVNRLKHLTLRQLLTVVNYLVKNYIVWLLEFCKCPSNDEHQKVWLCFISGCATCFCFDAVEQINVGPCCGEKPERRTSCGFRCAEFILSIYKTPPQNLNTVTLVPRSPFWSYADDDVLFVDEAHLPPHVCSAYNGKFNFFSNTLRWNQPRNQQHLISAHQCHRNQATDE